VGTHSIGDNSFGFAAFEGAAYQCGLDGNEGQKVDKLSEFFSDGYRGDGSQGANTVKHMLSYQHKSDGDSLRCSSCCWGGTRCPAEYETFYYAVRPHD
jgi:hypothetical protein